MILLKGLPLQPLAGLPVAPVSAGGQGCLPQAGATSLRWASRCLHQGAEAGQAAGSGASAASMPAVLASPLRCTAGNSVGRIYPRPWGEQGQALPYPVPRHLSLLPRLEHTTVPALGHCINPGIGGLYPRVAPHGPRGAGGSGPTGTSVAQLVPRASHSTQEPPGCSGRGR